LILNVIAIDPGVTTGYARGKISEGHLYYFPFQILDDVDDLWRRLVETNPRHIIIEDFEFRQGKQRTGLNLFPIQLIGVARLYSLIGNLQCAVHIQKASFGKQYYSDNILKNYGFYKRGIPHAMDASRHLLQWFTFGAGYQYNSGTKEFATRLDEWVNDSPS
jgi:hypothetical protein